MFICYICLTLGTSEDLNRFDCYNVEDGRCGHELKFILKEGVPEAIGVPHAADNINLLTSLNEDEPVDNTFTRNDSLWRNRNRGISVENSKDCDAIFRQFFNVSLFRSMILHETEDLHQRAIGMSLNVEPEQQ